MMDSSTGLMEAESKPIMEVEELSVEYDGNGKENFRAVNGVSFTLNEGEILGIAGESGCGKSSTLRAISGLIPARDGNVLFEDMDLLHLDKTRFNYSRKQIQMIFQDPYSSLNPRWRIGRIIAEPLVNISDLNRDEIRTRVKELMDICGIPHKLLSRFPHELSGGQCQRVGIARALAVNPRVLLCDEPVSALDVVIQNQIIELLKELQEKFKLSVIFVSHDLAVVSELCTRLIIMKGGEIVESGTTAEIIENPRHDYTRQLLACVPIPDPQRKII